MHQTMFIHNLRTFLPPDAMRKPIFAVARCLSVRLSRWCIVSRRLKILKLLSRPGSPHSIVFDPERRYTQFQGEPLQQGRKIHEGWANFAIFYWNRRLSRKRYNGCYGSSL